MKTETTRAREIPAQRKSMTMPEKARRVRLSEKKNPLSRFGQIAVEKGFVTEEHLEKALSEQVANDPYVRLRPHRLLGEILFERGWIKYKQLEAVLSKLSQSENEPRRF